MPPRAPESPWDGGAGEEGGLEALGEEALIQRLARIVPGTGPGVELGIGDDTAAVRFQGVALVTCDIQVEGVHFTRDLCAPADVGWRALAVNLSDVAAMGGVPRYAVVSLAIPRATPLAALDDLYQGLGELARDHGVTVIGGNVSASPGPLVVDVTVLGEAQRLVGRGGARPGDSVWLSGWAGKAAAGMYLLQHPQVAVPGREALEAAYRRPSPRVGLGKALGAQPLVTALVDTSDGVATDLLHLATASGVGVRLDLAQVPVPEGLREAAQAAGTDPWAWVLGGGEDYELLFTAAPGFEEVAPSLAASCRVPVVRVGDVVAAADGCWIESPEGPVPLRPTGWNHFRRKDSSHPPE